MGHCEERCQIKRPFLYTAIPSGGTVRFARESQQHPRDVFLDVMAMGEHGQSAGRRLRYDFNWLLGAEWVLAQLAEEMDCDQGDFLTRQKGTPLRPFAAHFLTHYAGLSQRQVAEVLAVSTGAAVCLQLRRFEELVAGHKPTRRLADQCKTALDEALKKLNAANT